MGCAYLNNGAAYSALIHVTSVQQHIRVKNAFAFKRQVFLETLLPEFLRKFHGIFCNIVLLIKPTLYTSLLYNTSAPSYQIQSTTLSRNELEYSALLYIVNGKGDHKPLS